MRRPLFYLILIALLLPACSKKGATITTVKPKYHHRWYDRKKDRHTPRIKKLRVRN